MARASEASRRAPRGGTQAISPTWITTRRRIYVFFSPIMTRQLERRQSNCHSNSHALYVQPVRSCVNKERSLQSCADFEFKNNFIKNYTDNNSQYIASIINQSTISVYSKC